MSTLPFSLLAGYPLTHHLVWKHNLARLPEVETNPKLVSAFYAIKVAGEIEMSSKEKTKSISLDELQLLALYIYMVVRNGMEDFHAKYLSDEMMKDLNPIIRNSVFAASYAYNNYHSSNVAKGFVDFQIGLIPDYWEEPKLLDDYLEAVRYLLEKHNGEDNRN